VGVCLPGRDDTVFHYGNELRSGMANFAGYSNIRLVEIQVATATTLRACFFGKPHQGEAMRLIRGAFATCTGMCGNIAQTGSGGILGECD